MNICTKIRIKNYLLDNVLRSTIPDLGGSSLIFSTGFLYSATEENVFDVF